MHARHRPAVGSAGAPQMRAEHPAAAVGRAHAQLLLCLLLHVTRRTTPGSQSPLVTRCAAELDLDRPLRRLGVKMNVMLCLNVKKQAANHNLLCVMDDKLHFKDAPEWIFTVVP